MKDHWDLGFLCCSGGHEKKFRPCRHFLWNSNSYSQPSNVSHHGGMNADHADCSTSYSSWF